MSRIICGNCLDIMQGIGRGSVDLVFGSPPYEDARKVVSDPFPVLKGQDWVDWMVKVYIASLRVCTGLVAYVVQGRTRNYQWSCVPALLIADLHRKGINVRNPPLYQRSGIPGSGGPDWLRSDYEWIICASHKGRLPWSNNIAMGKLPKYKPGGAPTNRMQNGRRVRVAGAPTMYFGKDRGDIERIQKYIPPKRANPGNVICSAGGHLGSKTAHENEAPFPEALARFIIKSFCPPSGTVLDPFSGSGTTCAVAKRWGRDYIGIDIRKSQCDLTRRRLRETKCLKRKL